MHTQLVSLCFDLLLCWKGKAFLKRDTTTVITDPYGLLLC